MLPNGPHLVFSGSAAEIYRHRYSSRSIQTSFKCHGDWSFRSLPNVDNHVRGQIFLFDFVLAFDPANIETAPQVLLGSDGNVRDQLDVCDLRTFHIMSLFWG